MKKQRRVAEAFSREDDSGLAPEDMIRALKSEVASLKRANAKIMSGEQLILHAVEKAFEEAPDFVVPKRPARSRKKHTEIAVLHCTDTQIGKRTESYDSSVAEIRLLRMVEKACEVTQDRQSYAKINELHLVLGGDMIEGETIFPGQAHEIDQGVFEQACKTSPAIFVRMILRLLEVYETIHVDCVPGNHGRPGSRSQGNHPKTNWDRVLYETLKVALHGTDIYPRKELRERVQFNIADTFYTHFFVYDWGVMVVHGDQITGGFAGYPWYGVGRKTYGWIDSIKEPWDYLLLGHFHQIANALVNHREWLAGGTPESGNVYAQNNLAATGYPIQRLYFFSKRHGLISDHRLYLDGGERCPQKLRHVE